MARLVSKSEAARIAGVSAPAVTKACRRLLAPALVADRLDIDHPAFGAYLAARGRTTPEPDATPTDAPKTPTPESSPPMASAKRRREREPEPTAPPPKATGEELDAYASVLRPIIARFGTRRNFRDWLLSLKDIEVIREKTLANEETEGRLISRELVRTHVIGAIEAGNRRLLNDSPKTIARRLYAAAKSGVAVEEAEQTVREIIGSHLEPVKRAAAKQLRGES